MSRGYKCLSKNHSHQFILAIFWGGEPEENEPRIHKAIYCWNLQKELIHKRGKLQGEHHFRSRYHTIKGTFLFWNSAVNTLMMFLLFILPTHSMHLSLSGRPLHVALVVSCVVDLGAENTARLLRKETRTLKQFKRIYGLRSVISISQGHVYWPQQSHVYWPQQSSKPS